MYRFVIFSHVFDDMTESLRRKEQVQYERTILNRLIPRDESSAKNLKDKNNIIIDIV